MQWCSFQPLPVEVGPALGAHEGRRDRHGLRSELADETDGSGPQGGHPEQVAPPAVAPAEVEMAVRAPAPGAATAPSGPPPAGTGRLSPAPAGRCGPGPSCSSWEGPARRPTSGTGRSAWPGTPGATVANGSLWPHHTTIEGWCPRRSTAAVAWRTAWLPGAFERALQRHVLPDEHAQPVGRVVKLGPGDVAVRPQQVEPGGPSELHVPGHVRSRCVRPGPGGWARGWRLSGTAARR